MSGIIDPEHVSFESIRQDLIDYVQSREDYASWQNFLESGVGSTLEDLLAGLGAFGAFHAVGAKRESTLEDALIYSSVVRICSMLGYAVNRVQAPTLTLTLSMDRQVYWDRNNPIAFYGAKPVCLTQSGYLLPGSNTLDCYVGAWTQYTTLAADTRKFVRILVSDTGVDNTLGRLELRVNGVLVPLVRYAEEALPTNVGIVTHPDGVLLVFGDDYVYRQMRKNDAITFTYVQTEGNLGVGSLLSTDLAPEVGTITGVTLRTRGSDRDEIEKLRTVAPGFHASRGRMVSPKDHVNIFLSYSGDLTSAGYRSKAGYCCTSELSYLYTDEHVMSESEENDVRAYLDDFRIIGESLEFVDPIKVCLDFRVTVVTERGTDPENLKVQIQNLIRAESFKLGYTFRPGTVLDGISALTGVKRVYLVQPASDRELAFNEYLKLTNLVVTVVDESTRVTVSPSNNGYTYCS